MKIQLSHTFEDIIEVENLLEAWKEFVRGKRSKADVLVFSLQLMGNLSELNSDLNNHTYHHGSYQAFFVHDPKPRSIHKALVRDRLLHHAVHRILYPFFDKTFIADSYSCRAGKGTHKALRRFRTFTYKVSKNNTRICWILKCDIQKFFASIDQDILLGILREYITDVDILWLLESVIQSFCSGVSSKGLPLGNLTSQLFANIYMNEFDQFVKHTLKAKYYIRYADDFVIFSENRNWLQALIPQIGEFLSQLKLELHPDKLFVKTLASGVDFLGWVHFSDHRVLRTATKRRMMKRITEHPTPETLSSYIGLLGHGNARKLKALLLKTDEF
ncbi:MAG: group II intron reverse transcriptase domain-containing protein [Candidatus Niyogibacteria bacterium]|nr:group II intron reverse transcriptase domain-containing protein [Candidatus Niyogibacteria bacterium]